MCSWRKKPVYLNFFSRQVTLEELAVDTHIPLHLASPTPSRRLSSRRGKCEPCSPALRGSISQHPCPHRHPRRGPSEPGRARLGSAENSGVPGRPTRGGAGGAREAGGLSGAPHLAPPGLLGLGAGAGGSPGTRAKPCMMSFCLPPNCGVGVGWWCQLEGPLPGREATPGEEK